MRRAVLAALPPDRRARWEAQQAYMGSVTGLSGMLYAFPKDERRAQLQRALAQLPPPPRPDVYLPTNPDCRVVGHVPSSAREIGRAHV